MKDSERIQGANDLAAVQAEYKRRYLVSDKPEPTAPAEPASALSRMAKDAARYRWLRDSKTMDNLPQVYADDDCNTWLTGAELDAAIDAAMKG